jgi:hypothetical protein
LLTRLLTLNTPIFLHEGVIFDHDSSLNSWDDLAFTSEEIDPDSKKFQYTSFGLIDDNDTFYYGQLGLPKTEISLEQVRAALQPVSDNAIFPKWLGTELRKAPEPQSAKHFTKRPALELYEFLQKQGMEKQLFTRLVAEARVLQDLSQHPHPNLVRYHGCRVKRGYITGLILDRSARSGNLCTTRTRENREGRFYGSARVCDSASTWAWFCA